MPSPTEIRYASAWLSFTSADAGAIRAETRVGRTVAGVVGEGQNPSPPQRATMSDSRSELAITRDALDDRVVAGRVAVSVVDPLEAVEIGEH